jgi:hypothetical protein
MRRETLLAAGARLVTDPGFRARLFAGEDPGGLGLSADEAAVLRRLDPDRLGIVAEGYAGKRLEAVESAFPRTLALLEPWRPGARRRYLESTPFPADDGAERATFRAFAAADAPEGWRRRLAADLALVEEAVHALPLPAPRGYWMRDGLRPRRTASAWAGTVSGPLHQALDGSDGGYPERPVRVLALRAHDGLRLEPLDEAGAWLWDSCSGGPTLADLRAQRPGSEARLESWLRLGAVEDAAR